MNIYVYSFNYIFMSTYLPRKVPCLSRQSCPLGNEQNPCSDFKPLNYFICIGIPQMLQVLIPDHCSKANIKIK